MNLLIIGGGGREHALAWKLSQSPRVTKIYCAPGNAGHRPARRKRPAGPSPTPDGLLNFAKAHAGRPDRGRSRRRAGRRDRGRVSRRPGRRIFGPTREAARLEWSKIFTKDFLLRHGIPTAAAGRFERSADAHRFCIGKTYPLVIKADGLATGKGVIVAEHPAAAAEAIYEMMERGRFGAAGRRVLIEEFLHGPECSLHALIDGKVYHLLPVAQDYKRIGEGDTGANTGGMGAVSPPVIPLGEETERRIDNEIMLPLMAGLHAENIHFQGMLFPGLMLTAAGPQVLEFNARFGDPETQVLLPRLQTDLLTVLEAVIDGRLDEVEAGLGPPPGGVRDPGQRRLSGSLPHRQTHRRSRHPRGAGGPGRVRFPRRNAVRKRPDRHLRRTRARGHRVGQRPSPKPAPALTPPPNASPSRAGPCGATLPPSRGSAKIHRNMRAGFPLPRRPSCLPLSCGCC